MALTRTATVQNGIGDEVAVTIKLCAPPAPHGVYESILIQLAKRHGLPPVPPYRVIWPEITLASSRPPVR